MLFHLLLPLDFPAENMMGHTFWGCEIVFIVIDPPVWLDGSLHQDQVGVPTPKVLGRAQGGQRSDEG